MRRSLFLTLRNSFRSFFKYLRNDKTSFTGRRNFSILIIVATIIFLGLIGKVLYFSHNINSKAVSVVRESLVHSQYAGEEERSVKSLSREDIEGLKMGAGTPLGGLAKLAELNGYPGPRHVLDAIEANELDATAEQKAAIKALYDEMRPQAVSLGIKFIAVEKDLNNAFVTKSINEKFLEFKLDESARIYAKLRFVHLKYHLSTMAILTFDQVASYNLLRGYTADPCKNIPQGHDSSLWKAHNNCG